MRRALRFRLAFVFGLVDLTLMADVAAVPESPFARPGRVGRARLWLRPTRAGWIPQEKFRVLQRGWRKQVWLYAVAVALLPAALLAAGSSFLSPPDPQFFWGFCVGAGGALFPACMYLAVPDRIDNWRRGAEGERRTARKLRRLESQGWIAYHSVPTENGDRDHILLGPRGIFLLDSKAWHGQLSVDNCGQLVVRHGEDLRPDRSEPLGRRATASASSLAKSILRQTRYQPYVHAVVVLWGDFPARLVRHDHVTFVHGDDLTQWLETAQTVPLVRSYEADVVAAVARFIHRVDDGQPPLCAGAATA